MGRFILRRLVFMVLSIMGATLIVFGLSRLAGDPRYLYLGSSYVTKETWEAWGKEFGLDKPLVVQYGIWLSKAVHGEFGKSLGTGYPAIDMIRRAAPATLQLASAAWIVSIVTGVLVGVVAAVKRGSLLDLAGRSFAFFGQALAPFWLGLMLILLFSVRLGWLPTSQRGGVDHYILPAITLGWLPAAGMARLVRSSMLEILDSEYIKFARAKGVGEWLVIWKHALKNALIPPLTFGAMTLAGFLTGTVVTETVFAWPGLGRLTVTAINNNDFSLMTAAVLIFTVIYLVVVFLIDIAYAYIDPRIRYG